jgi:hypothetical protein
MDRPQKPVAERFRPNHLKTLRAGYEIVGGLPPHASSPVVASHRRSGTHHLGEFIRRNWEMPWFKSHDWPERLSPEGRKCVFIVRNPIDAIYATWQWFTSSGGSHNPAIASGMDTVSFGEFLSGGAGRLFGYRKHQVGRVDSLAISRGMFYDPICYWADHLNAFIDAGTPIVVHERLIDHPEDVAEFLSKHLFAGKVPDNIDPVTEQVGLSPRGSSRGEALAHWPEKNLEDLRMLLQPHLSTLQYSSLEEWITSP